MAPYYSTAMAQTAAMPAAGRVLVRRRVAPEGSPVSPRGYSKVVRLPAAALAPYSKAADMSPAGESQRFPPGTAVEYLSHTRDAWTPAMVKGFNEETRTYVLDIQPAARPERVRLPGFAAASEGPPEATPLSADGCVRFVRNAEDFSPYKVPVTAAQPLMLGAGATPKAAMHSASAPPATKAPLLPCGAAVEYFSSRGVWVPAVIEGYNSETETYALDIQPYAFPHKVRRMPDGSNVEYYSKTCGTWVPAVVQGFDEERCTYVLDIQPIALSHKVRHPIAPVGASAGVGGGSVVCNAGGNSVVCAPGGGSVVCNAGGNSVVCAPGGGSVVCNAGDGSVFYNAGGGSVVCNAGGNSVVCAPGGGSVVCNAGDGSVVYNTGGGGSVVCNAGGASVVCHAAGVVDERRVAVTNQILSAPTPAMHRQGPSPLLQPAFQAPPVAGPLAPGGSSIGPGAILCVGDSLTSGQAAGGTDNYPTNLQKMISAAGYSQKVINGGVWGATAEQILELLPMKLKQGGIGHISCIVVLGGTNDLLSLRAPAAPILARLERVHAAAEAAPGNPVVAIATLPPTPCFQEAQEQNRLEVNANLRRIAQGHSRRILVEFENVPTSLCTDYIHYEGEGYVEFARRAMEALRPHLR
eukprot:TRINITY_DN6296_c0_g1_i2.p1 TRINITY_DN6296_c0_g1~~TRINITY_DN6296_c0_g1_i2.p1  ORF type:complete len:637 (+),score=156.60 TRINITY_DN6296_c0_g1_i2:27-1937(+)